jgi:glucan phosphoethanolaminetransferase (alkaline phosphatase superfamily)
MRAVSLLAVFIVAKICVLAGRALPLSAWTPIAYVWQDLLVASLFALVDWWLRRPLAGWAAYGLVVLYTALNVPVARTLSTPLTWPLLRAAGGPLKDSIISYATWANVALLLLILAAASILPFAVRRLPRRHLAVTAALLVPLVIIAGPVATARVDTCGLHRNVLSILLTTALPRIGAQSFSGDERSSPFGGELREDLSYYQGSAAGRNVVHVVLESTAARYLRPYGAAEDPMPHLTGLTAQSILFENAYAVYPESIKGFFSVLCSTYPAFDTSPEIYARVRPPSLAGVLAAAGYHTALFHSGRFEYLGMEAIVRNRGYHTLEDAGDIGGDHHSSFGVDDERITVRRLLAWIDSLPKGERFFVTYLPIAGHHPYSSPDAGPFSNGEAIGRYRNALHHADAAIACLLEGLERRGLSRKTLIIIHGDHGEAFGQHDGNFAHTLFIYEENIHVPLLIAFPGLVQQPVRIRRVASLIDIAPTILDLLGLPIPDVYQGKSLLDARPCMALFFTDYSLGLLGLRDGDWKFIYELDSGRSKLYDLNNDPDEARDRSAQEPERITAYRKHLTDWSAGQKGRILAHPAGSTLEAK